MATGKAVLDKLLASRKKNPYGQFGTTDDESTDNGQLACTHAVWRFIIHAYTGKWYSFDQISHMAGFPFGGGSRNRGMSVDEAKRLILVTKIPYVYKNNLTGSELLIASNKGPVMFAMRYGNWPNWFKYRGKTTHSPYARPVSHAGRNQFTGFFGSHAGVLLGFVRVMSGGKFVRNDCYVFEPNHNSPARPEKVPYDVVTQTDLTRAYLAVKTQLGWSVTMAFVPTKAPTFPGGL